MGENININDNEILFLKLKLAEELSELSNEVITSITKPNGFDYNRIYEEAGDVKANLKILIYLLDRSRQDNAISKTKDCFQKKLIQINRKRNESRRRRIKV